MPQEPKRKHSKARKRTRRAAIKLAEVNLVECIHCHKKTLAHQVCEFCGFYKGKQVQKKRSVQVTKV